MNKNVFGLQVITLIVLQMCDNLYNLFYSQIFLWHIVKLQILIYRCFG